MASTPAAAPDGVRRRHDLDSLLAVAVRVFTERGYDGTSMGDVAAASGLSKSSIYHHVESKEQLLRLALERAVEPLFAVTREPGASQGPAIRRLEHVVRRVVQVLAEQLPYVTLLLRVHGNTETERWALDRRRRFDRFVTRLVSEAAAQGDVRTDVDAAVVTRLLFGMINSLVEWYDPAAGAGRTRAAPPLTPEALADAVVRLAFDGLRA
jgi:AcrR family transcriptional regulator